MNDKIVWQGRPSQIVNLPVFLICALLVALVVPVLFALYYYLQIRCTSYELYENRLTIRSGILNRLTDDLELYRVSDYRFEQPIFLRIFSLGNLTLYTTDKSDGVVVLKAIKDGENLRLTVRTLVEKCRGHRHVREIDIV